MYQIDVPSAATTLPAATALGQPGYFTDGDVVAGVDPTIVPAEFLNAVMLELLGVVSGAGLTPAKGQNGQVLAAIRSLIRYTPTSASAVNTTGGATVLSLEQYSASIIVVTGALTSNASIIVPAAVGRWTIINATTGNFTLACYASGGTGVFISQGGLDDVVCNGASVKYAVDDAATKTAVQTNALCFGVDGGSANLYSIDFTPAIKSFTNGMRVMFRAANANSGACQMSVNGSTWKPLLGRAHAALQGGEVAAGGIAEAVWIAALDSWVLLACTGAAVQVPLATQPQHAISLAQAQSMSVGLYVNSARTLAVGNYLVDTSAGAFLLLLPAAPSKGDMLTFIDPNSNWGGTNWTLGRNGKTIMGQASDLVINVSDQKFSIWFNGTDWRLA